MKAHNIISMTLAGLLSNVVLADTQVIHAGELLAVPGNSTLKKQTIVITDGKISQIKKGFITPASIDINATFVDLSKSFVMPGLMDMHVHLQGELGPKNDSQTLRLLSSYIVT